MDAKLKALKRLEKGELQRNAVKLGNKKLRDWQKKKKNLQKPERVRPSGCLVCAFFKVHSSKETRIGYQR